MSRTEKIHSKYGDVEVEVVDCDSCGETIAKRDAYRFAVNKNPPNPRFNDAERSGYACEYCVDGPVSFPEKVREWSFPKNEKTHGEYGVLFHLIFGVVFLPFIMADGFSNEDEFSQGYATGIIVETIYVTALLLWWFL